MPRQQYRQIINYLIVLLRDDVDTDELKSTIKDIPHFEILDTNTQKVSFYKNTLDYLIGVGNEYLRRIGTKQTRNSINKTRRGGIREHMEKKFSKIGELLHDYSERKSINNKYAYGNGGYNGGLHNYMNNVVGELKSIHEKYFPIENPASSIKRSRQRSHGGTRKNRRTH